MIKAVFFDIDGTLVSFANHRIPQSSLQAIAELRQKGIKVFIATGRSEMLIHNIDTSLFDGVISVNGQFVRSGSEVIHKCPIPQDDVLQAIAYVERTGVTCLFESEGCMVVNGVSDTAREVNKIVDIRIPEPGDIRTATEMEIFQMIFYGDEGHESALLSAMPSSEATRWSPLFSDIISRGGGKHVGIDMVLQHYGIEREETMAFGDGGNDISMLRHVGTGIAMGNASDAVKSAADYVTASVDDDGVIKALRHFGVL